MFLTASEDDVRSALQNGIVVLIVVVVAFVLVGSLLVGLVMVFADMDLTSWLILVGVSTGIGFIGFVFGLSVMWAAILAGGIAVAWLVLAAFDTL